MRLKRIEDEMADAPRRPRGRPPKTEEALSHNLLGQRLGKKGRDTRERILSATERLLADPNGGTISLSAVAREASLAMTTLYLYFSDLTELLIAVLEPIMESAEETFIAQLRTRWPDDELGQHCLAFVESFYGFWDRHSRILHLRNSYAAGLDRRMVRHRTESSQPLIALLVAQMDSQLEKYRTPAAAMATTLLTGTERLVTIITDADFSAALGDQPVADVPNLLRGQARLLELGIRDCRDNQRNRTGA